MHHYLWHIITAWWQPLAMVQHVCQHHQLYANPRICLSALIALAQLKMFTSTTKCETARVLSPPLAMLKHVYMSTPLAVAQHIKPMCCAVGKAHHYMLQCNLFVSSLSAVAQPWVHEVPSLSIWPNFFSYYLQPGGNRRSMWSSIPYCFCIRF